MIILFVRISIQSACSEILNKARQVQEGYVLTFFERKRFACNLTILSSYSTTAKGASSVLTIMIFSRLSAFVIL